MKERYEDSVNIEGCKGKAVKSIINYFYSESIEINGENVMDLLAAADYLQVEDVRKCCFDFLEMEISPENSFEILSAANLYGTEAFTNQIYQFISRNFEILSQTNDFKSLTKEEYLTFLSKLDNKFMRESSNYHGLVMWTNHKVNRRKKIFSNLFQQTIGCSLSSTGIERVF